AGRSQIVGKWAGWTRNGALVGAGLARLSYPDGEFLDRVNLDVNPRGTPCWGPGTAARVIFAAHDGRLYRFAFDQRRGAEAAVTGRDRAPVALVRRAGGPAREGVFLLDPSWPADPRLERHLLVSLRLVQRAENDPSPELQELWWLRLDPSETAIEEAG